MMMPNLPTRAGGTKSRRRQDDIDQRAFDLVEQNRPGRNALLDGQGVFAVLLPPREYLVGRETVQRLTRLNRFSY